MLLKLARLSSLLLASAVALGNPSSRLEEQLARQYQARQTTDAVVQEVAQEPNTLWGGAAWEKAEGTFTSVTGTIVVPEVSGGNGTFAVAWVGIDGFGCGSAILQTGVDLMVYDEAPGGVWYTGWYQGYPEGSRYYPNMEIHSGQTILLNVTVESTTMGYAIIENLTSGQALVEEVFFDPSAALCQSSAEWIVQDFTYGQSSTYAEFSTITFTDAIAVGPDGTYTPCNSDIGLNNGHLSTNVDNDCNIVVSYT